MPRLKDADPDVQVAGGGHGGGGGQSGCGQVAAVGGRHGGHC